MLKGDMLRGKPTKAHLYGPKGTGGTGSRQPAGATRATGKCSRPTHSGPDPLQPASTIR